MNNAPATVLLAGDHATRSSTLRKWSCQLDCYWQFASSFEDACRLMSQKEFDLVLCQYNLRDRTAFPLLDWLEGSRSTLVFAARAGRGSRWLTMIERGQRCLDRPLLQTKDLPTTLASVLKEHPDGDSPREEILAGDLEQVGVR